MTINASGKGYALLNVRYRYNINYPNISAAFSLQPKIKCLNVDRISLDIDVNYQPSNASDSLTDSNFVVLEASLPSGFVINTELLDGLKSTRSAIKKIETKNADTVAVIYFEYRSSPSLAFSIEGIRIFMAEDQQPGSAVIYDYYDNNNGESSPISKAIAFRIIQF